MRLTQPDRPGHDVAVLHLAGVGVDLGQEVADVDVLAVVHHPVHAAGGNPRF